MHECGTKPVGTISIVTLVDVSIVMSLHFSDRWYNFVEYAMYTDCDRRRVFLLAENRLVYRFRSLIQVQPSFVECQGNDDFHPELRTTTLIRMGQNLRCSHIARQPVHTFPAI